MVFISEVDTTMIYRSYIHFPPPGHNRDLKLVFNIL